MRPRLSLSVSFILSVARLTCFTVQAMPSADTDLTQPPPGDVDTSPPIVHLGASPRHPRDVLHHRHRMRSLEGRDVTTPSCTHDAGGSLTPSCTWCYSVPLYCQVQTSASQPQISLYLTTILVGSPPMKGMAVVSNAVADFWVRDPSCACSDCPQPGPCKGSGMTSNPSSQTFQDTGNQFALQIPTNFQVSGKSVRDTVEMGYVGRMKSLTDFPLGSLVQMNEYSMSISYGTVLGLGRSKLAKASTRSPVSEMRNRKRIARAITSYKLPRLTDPPGSITFGGLDLNLYHPSTLVTVPNVNPDGFSSAKFTATVDGQNPFADNVERVGLFSLDLPIIYGPADDVRAVYQAITKRITWGDSYELPCDTTTTVALIFKGVSFTIDTRDLMGPPTPNDPSRCSFAFLPSSSSSWTLGHGFLRNVYFSTNEDDNTVSLAKLL